MYSQTQIDPVVSFRNSQREHVRGTIINLQRKSLVMEVYNPYSIVQVSEVLSELSVRMGTKNAYLGKAVVVSLVNTGLTAVVSLALIDEWRELSVLPNEAKSVGREAELFISDWDARFNIRRDYQIVVNEMRAFLSEVSRWVEQVDLTESLPKAEGGRLRADLFYELATPIMLKIKFFLDRLEEEAERVDAETAPVHRTYAQSALHPLLLRAPFVYRTFTKPLGYAGDYEMVNQILSDPQQGPTTYFQIVNTAFLQAAVATAHRNRIALLIDFLTRQAEAARAAGRPFRILNVGCGPAFEIQRFVREYPHPELLSFELVDFSNETLAFTKDAIESSANAAGHKASVEMVHQSVHDLLKRKISTDPAAREFDAVYCAGLFDYLSDKVCARLLSYFAARTRPGGQLLVTNVHSANPEKYGMEHLLEWYLIYRNESGMSSLLPANSTDQKLYVDETGVNVFAEATIL
ncbi:MULTISPECIES: class I SAM-dependent methyltransferase [Paraburkholderia]|uniref:Class I SAM-dependent methyltransferase n=1 Tax=Paraburkholderia podalyriae TaxID=1938811 RepID=A0ABR7PLF0_9BURK|nr:class I SAM-dependent methyltransferase [Paraburkholderia podalyriae]MBC8747213.1 class I SAM-dependent methyltransferase [Paraburkholderia podalyriae]